MIIKVIIYIIQCRNLPPTVLKFLTLGQEVHFAAALIRLCPHIIEFHSTEFRSSSPFSCSPAWLLALNGSGLAQSQALKPLLAIRFSKCHSPGSYTAADTSSQALPCGSAVRFVRKIHSRLWLIVDFSSDIFMVSLTLLYWNQLYLIKIPVQQQT